MQGTSAAHAREVFAVADPALLPLCAVLDPALTLNLPPHLTATTGMDALTRAVEAYIGRSNARGTRRMAERAVRLVFENLRTAHADGNDMQARANMLMAAHCAGIASARAHLGYVHALAHALGGLYGLPHALANAVLLPHVLARYGTAACARLSELSVAAGTGGISDTPTRRTARFIGAIREMNRAMGIPGRLEGIRKADIPLLAERALREANPAYPAPRIFTKRDFEAILRVAAG